MGRSRSRSWSRSPRRRSRSPWSQYSKSPAPQQQGDPAKVYVGSIPFDWTKSDIQQEFNTYGEILEVNIPPGANGAANKGICFITFENSDCARRCIDKANGSDIQGREIKVSKAVRKGPGGGKGGGGHDRNGGGKGYTSPRSGYDRGSGRGNDRGSDRYGGGGRGSSPRAGADRWDPRESNRDDFPQRDRDYDDGREHNGSRRADRDDRREADYDEPRREKSRSAPRSGKAKRSKKADPQTSEKDKSKLKDLTQAISELERQIAQLTKSEMQYKQQAAEARAKKDEALTQTTHKQKQTGELSARSAALEQQAKSAKQRIASLQEDAANWESKYENRRKDLEQMAHLTAELFASKEAFEASKTACENLTQERADWFAKLQYALNVNSNPQVQQVKGVVDSTNLRSPLATHQEPVGDDSSRQPVSFSMFGTQMKKR